MVFESIVVELVNRFLGDYIENLDKSQLSLSIWGGNVYFGLVTVELDRTGTAYHEYMFFDRHYVTIVEL